MDSRGRNGLGVGEHSLEPFEKGLDSLKFGDRTRVGAQVRQTREDSNQLGVTLNQVRAVYQGMGNHDYVKAANGEQPFLVEIGIGGRLADQAASRGHSTLVFSCDSFCVEASERSRPFVVCFARGAPLEFLLRFSS